LHLVGYLHRFTKMMHGQTNVETLQIFLGIRFIINDSHSSKRWIYG